MATTTHDSSNGLPSNEIPCPSKVPAAGHSPVHIETRDDLSLLFKIVRTCIKPLKPHLVSLKDVYPTSSPRLQNHPTSHYGVKIVERSITLHNTPEFPLLQLDSATNTQTLWLYDCEPCTSDLSKREITRHIYFFAGGGFKAPATGDHWKLCAKLAKQLAPQDIAVTLVSYPLAPNSPAWASLPLLQAWLIQTVAELDNSRSNETISLLGDSAGGNIVVCLGFWLAKLAARRADLASSLKRIDHVFSISGPMDFTNTNPDIKLATECDPVLTQKVTDDAAERWVKDYPRNGFEGDIKAHPELSPSRETEDAWRMLRDSGIRLDGLFGTADTLAPDCRVFMERCRVEGIRGNWLVWEGQMHCFPLIQSYGISEGRAGLQWMCDHFVK